MSIDLPEICVGGARVDLRPARLEEIVDLRHEVLRHGLPRSEAIFDGDDAPTSRHYGAFVDGRTACCATLHASRWEGEPAWQLRGMATDARLRSHGIGRAVMAMLEADVLATSPIHLLWANTRIGAIRFYQGLGWEIRSDLFEIPTAGMHYRMTKRLVPA